MPTWSLPSRAQSPHVPQQIAAALQRTSDPWKDTAQLNGGQRPYKYRMNRLPDEDGRAAKLDERCQPGGKSARSCVLVREAFTNATSQYAKPRSFLAY